MICLFTTLSCCIQQALSEENNSNNETEHPVSQSRQSTGWDLRLSSPEK